MSFEPLRHVIHRRVESSPMTAEFKSARILSLFPQVLEKRWGSARASFVQPLSLRMGVLKVQTANAAAKQELSRETAILRNELNRAFGSSVVTEIQVVLSFES